MCLTVIIPTSVVPRFIVGDRRIQSGTFVCDGSSGEAGAEEHLCYHRVRLEFIVFMRSLNSVVCTCASRMQQMSRLVVVTADANVRIYNINPAEGGDCKLVKQYK